MLACHGLLSRPFIERVERADRPDRPSIAKLSGMMVIADMQMPCPIDAKADAVVSILQVVFAVDVMGLEGVENQVTLHHAHGLGINVKSGELVLTAGENSMMAEYDGIDGVTGPGIAQLMGRDDVDSQCSLFLEIRCWRYAVDWCSELKVGQRELAVLLIDAGLCQQALICPWRADRDGGLKMPEQSLVLTHNSGGTTQGVVDPRYQNLGDQFLAATPVNRQPCVFTRFSSIAQGLMPSGSEQCEFGSVWMVLKSVALDPGQTLPVTKLPLGAAAFEQVFVVGKG